MELELRRVKEVGEATIGELRLDGDLLCYTLEDKVREPSKGALALSVSSWKIPGKTAIPRGRYALALTWSPRFGRVLPLLKQVPGFEGVRIHTGNRVSDTEGCILVGMETQGESLFLSRKAYGILLEAISILKPDNTRVLKEETWMTIT